MNFTREPLIESVISSNDGYKLRLTKITRNKEQEEDFLVDALEVVSFGSSYFYRHREKPKSFLLPVNEYVLVQVKDTRLSLKYATVDKSIKITPDKEMKKSESRSSSGKSANQNVKEGQKEKVVDKKVQKKPSKTKVEKKEIVKEPKSTKVVDKDQGDQTTARVLAPPLNLISDSLKKYKGLDLSDKSSYSILPPPPTIMAPPIIEMPKVKSLDETQLQEKKKSVAKAAVALEGKQDNGAQKASQDVPDTKANNKDSPEETAKNKSKKD